MSSLRTSCLLLPPLMLACAASAQSVTIDFMGIGSSEVAYNGPASQLSFVPDTSTGYDFQIASSNIPGLDGDLGVVEGSFNIGTVHTLSFGPPFMQQAALAGTTTLLISDGTADQLSATLTWNSVTIDGMTGTLNSLGDITLSNFVYHGSDPALLLLSEQSSGVGSATFHELPRNAFFNLESGNSVDASGISGSFEAIPEPSYTAAFLGAVILLVCMAAGRRRERAVLALAP